MRECTGIGLIPSVLLSLSICCHAQSSDSHVLSLDLPGNKLTISHSSGKTIISSEELEMTMITRKPATSPETSDKGKWTDAGSESVHYNLFGHSGELTTSLYRTITGEIGFHIWTSSTSSLVAFRQVYTNSTRKPVLLESLTPLYIDGKEKFRFGRTSDWVLLEQFRHKNDMPKSEYPQKGKTVKCDPLFIINENRGTGRNLLMGSQTFDLHLADISISFDNDLNLTSIEGTSDFENVEVPPGGSRASQWFIISLEDDINIQFSEYTKRLIDYHNPPLVMREAPAVYCTWYYHALNYNEEIFKKDIEHFRKNRIPFDVFLIDECWDVDDWGDFEPINTFPGGMKKVAEEITSAGYIPGIWSAPYLVDSGSDLANKNPAWLLKNSRGEKCIFRMNDKDHFILDLTFPGVCKYLEEQFRKISGTWDYRYFKFDFMRSVFLDTDQQFYDKSATSLEAYRRGLEAIRRGVGHEAYISVCGGHYGASLGIADSQRSGSDVKSRWNTSEIPKYRQNIMRTWMSPLWHVDPDAMMVRRQLKPLPGDTRDLTIGLFSDDEAFTNAVNQFMGGDLVTFTEDFSVIDEDRRMLYKHVIPSVNSSSRPLDIFNTNCPEIMITEIDPVAEDLEAWIMVTVVNWSDEIRDYSLVTDDIIPGIMKNGKYIVFDFVRQEIICVISGSEKLNLKGVAAHQSRLLKVVPWDGRSAMFLGTDLNFSCGGLEITDIRFREGEISGAIDTPWHLPVNLTFLIPGRNGFEKKTLTVLSGQKRFWLRY